MRETESHTIHTQVCPRHARFSPYQPFNQITTVEEKHVPLVTKRIHSKVLDQTNKITKVSVQLGLVWVPVHPAVD
jgi:hypothetical protein